MKTSHVTGRRPSLVFAIFLGIMSIFALAAPLHAQVVSDPRVAEFDPSPDHAATLNSGQPAVVRYELGVYLCGASAPFTTIDMGKPSPEGDGKIRFDFASSVAGWPLPGGNYEARVSAVGPEGSAPSEPSNPFTFSTGSSCTYALSAISFEVPAVGGSYSVNVATGASCPWSVTTAVAWVTLWTSGSTTGGAVPFGVQANTSTSRRTGTITVAGQTVTISQDAAAAPAPKTTPTISWATPAAITQGTALSPTQLNATASVPGTFVYTPAAGTVLTAGTFALTTAFTPADTLLYNAASASTTITVSAGTTSGGTTTTTGGSTTGGPSGPPPDDNVLPLGAPYTLTITQPTGGTVKSAGINCGTRSKSCTVNMPGPMTLGLQAAPDAGYEFLSWSGHCSGTAASYALALEGPRTCGANFVPAGSKLIGPTTSGGTTAGSSLPMGAPYTLTVTRPIGGTVNAAGVDCGTRGKQCSVTMPAALWLELQATPDRGYVFTSWTGHCGNGTQPSYSLPLEGPRTCGAVFTATK